MSLAELILLQQAEPAAYARDVFVTAEAIGLAFAGKDDNAARGRFRYLQAQL